MSFAHILIRLFGFFLVGFLLLGCRCSSSVDIIRAHILNNNNDKYVKIIM